MGFLSNTMIFYLLKLRALCATASSLANRHMTWMNKRIPSAHTRFNTFFATVNRAKITNKADSVAMPPA
jgi:hypothetical protein